MIIVMTWPKFASFKVKLRRSNPKECGGERVCTLPLQGAEVEVEPAAQEHSTEMTVCALRHKCTGSYNLVQSIVVSEPSSMLAGTIWCITLCNVYCLCTSCNGVNMCAHSQLVGECLVQLSG